ncbi:MAG: hypothetical protein AAGB15_01825 [Pseudomonadota bacterium]
MTRLFGTLGAVALTLACLPLLAQLHRLKRTKRSRTRPYDDLRLTNL